MGRKRANSDEQTEVPGAESDRYSYNANCHRQVKKYLDALREQKSWEKTAKEAKPFAEQAMGKAEVDYYELKSGDSFECVTHGDTWKATLAKGDDGKMLEPGDPQVTVEVD